MRLLVKFKQEMQIYDVFRRLVEQSEDGVRFGNCEPPGIKSRTHNYQQREAQPVSDSPQQAIEALRQTIADEPDQANVALWHALRDPQLESLRTDVLLEVRRLGEQALPLVEAVVPFLDKRIWPAPEVNCAAYALAAMGPGADIAIREWMVKTPAATWENGLASLFYPLGPDRSVELLRAALRSGNGDAKLSACKLIATDMTCTWEALLPDIVAVIADGDPWVCAAGIDALVGIGWSALETMWSMTESPHAQIRVAGLDALGRYAVPFPGANSGWINIGDREPFALLAAKLKDSEPMVRVAAAVALQKVAVALSNSTLATEMEAADPELQAAIAKGYQECIVHQSGDRRLRDSIRNQIPRHSASPSVMRRLAAADLVISADVWPDESSPLYAALHDWEDPRREEYLEAIRLAGSRAKGLMAGIARCTAASPPIQVAALKALAAMGDDVTEEAVDRTIICLESAYLEVRQAAANALGDFGPLMKRETTIALRKALIDDDRRIGSEACVALGKMKKLANDAVADIGVRVTRLGPVAINALAGIGTQNARQEVLRIYQRYADAAVADKDDDEYEWNVWIRDVSREWLLSWGMISSDQDDAT